MEFIEVVDKFGNYTGQVVERKKVHNLRLPHWEVIILIVNDRGQILLQKRSTQKRFYPNKWSLCSGLVIAGESVEEGALRELQEELGIKVLKEDLKLLEENLDLTRFYYVVCSKEERDFSIQEEELSCVKWYYIDEVIAMIKSHDDSITMKENRLEIFYKIKEILT